MDTTAIARQGSAHEEQLPEPPGLEVYRARIGGEDFAVLRWPVGAPAAMRGRGARLSRAEDQILALVLTGLPTSEIALKRGRSRRTVENQLALLYAKLGVRSRLELFARFAATCAGLG